MKPSRKEMKFQARQHVAAQKPEKIFNIPEFKPIPVLRIRMLGDGARGWAMGIRR